MHPGVGELHLRLDTHSARHPAARGVLGQVVQERRLAHTRLPAHHQGTALTCANSVDKLAEHVAFAAPAPQLPSGPPQAGESPSARQRHYAAPTPLRHAPRLGASRPAGLIKASLTGLEACTTK